MPNYTKLFNSIVTSTIWTEDDKTRIVWITMLALADQNGEVHSSIPGLSRLSAVPIADVERALEKFVSPDPYSRTPDNEGRRIVKIDGGWELLNHAKYRRMASKEDSKAATAERVKRHRARNAHVTPCNGDVTPCNAPVTVGRDIAEAEAEAEASKEQYAPSSSAKADVVLVNGISPQQRRMSPAKQKTERVNENTDLMNEVGSIIGRRKSTKWTVAEALQIEGIQPDTESIELLRRYYDIEMPKGEDYRRRSLETLLNHWNGEIDKATLYFIDNP